MVEALPVFPPTPAATRPDPNARQVHAATPEKIVWVGASAGSGKTKVLTDRVLRLMLPDPEGRWQGASPHRILCITFTKAAAAEMALRIQKRLGNWAILPEQDLLEELQKLTGKDGDLCQSLIAPARRLFAESLESSGKLSILTIHSFCQSVLGRFSVEAGLSPDFTVLDERGARHLLTDILHDTIRKAQQSTGGEIGAAFARLAPDLTLGDLTETLHLVLKDSRLLSSFIGTTPSLSALRDKILSGLGLAAGTTPAALFSEFRAHTPETDIRRAIAIMDGDKRSTVSGMAQKLALWLDAPDGDKFARLPELTDALLTQKKTPRSLGKFADEQPLAAEAIARLTDRILDFDDCLTRCRQALLTADIVLLAGEVLTRYVRDKRLQNLLDYDDLILKTRDLLERTSGTWVHYKLDEGIDHILVDEAQDTNRDQWEIVRLLCSEVFAGAARESSSPRSLFVVGDEKQSIFSFQGASPDAFSEMRDFFAEKSREAERDFESILLDTSFRTTEPVLRVVDEVFSNPALAQKIGLQPGEILKHYPHREKDAGLVELWPLPPPPEQQGEKKNSGWAFPFAAEAEKPPETGIAEQVAQTISFWLEKGEILPSEGRPITAGDILILVRTRGPLTHELIRQLKRRNVPVSGIDRLVLGDHIAVQDCLALARSALTPSDDFSLACLLKSPLVGIGEDELMDMALGRAGSLLSEVEKKRPEIAVWLFKAQERAVRQAPFEFFNETLISPCPADPLGSGWRSFFSRMGTDAADPLEEFLSYCIEMESQGMTSLSRLVGEGLKDRIEIKREMEEAGQRVRIMTVHASKGLEAGIVILPDTTSLPRKQQTEKFLWIAAEGQSFPLWSPKADFDCALFREKRDTIYEKQIEEYYRLLYVALTRARDRLYILGHSKTGSAKDSSWYALVQGAFSRLIGVKKDEESGKMSVSSLQEKEPEARSAPESSSLPEVSLPDWMRTSLESTANRPSILTPSHLLEEDNEAVFSPLESGESGRYQRGLATHRLFQFLPDIPEDKREAAGKIWMDRYADFLPQTLRDEILAEVLRILRDPVFGDVFGPGSLAEVPVSGIQPDGSVMSGQIDRLIIQPDRILIVDFKTGRPSPQDEKDIPPAYRAQMQAYLDLIRRIYPQRLVFTALLWTDRPALMPLTLA
jgi:ATP-dependent helicase/nuclease subunit A